jgi:deoxycytidylate deaminase
MGLAVMRPGPCAKRRTIALVVLKDGSSYVGENSCLTAQEVCPRAPGEGYEKCRTVCHQFHHAEEAALIAARRDNPLCDFEGARMAVSHHYGCASCTALLAKHGITADFIAPVDSERTPNQ